MAVLRAQSIFRINSCSWREAIRHLRRGWGDILHLDEEGAVVPLGIASLAQLAFRLEAAGKPALRKFVRGLTTSIAHDLPPLAQGDPSLGSGVPLERL